MDRQRGLQQRELSRQERNADSVNSTGMDQRCCIFLFCTIQSSSLYLCLKLSSCPCYRQVAPLSTGTGFHSLHDFPCIKDTIHYFFMSVYVCIQATILQPLSVQTIVTTKQTKQHNFLRAQPTSRLPVDAYSILACKTWKKDKQDNVVM
jgi:hypothetical protein